ncbi:carbonic anhydrase [Micromonospora sp. NPDC007208]|uniref:carbonic anhydrase n=1 Tax=Micromonospora sp. NPDC007208 TaxID=3364236 RepID=UPI0036B652FF
MSHTGSSGGQPGPQRTTDRATALSEPTRAYAELIAGNRRFVGGAPRHPNQDAEHRAAVADGQHPFAVIVGCSDSRLAAEIIFDRGLGDLFVVRTAGHTTGPEVLGSVEYAVTVLGTPLVVVLGHDSCGAVQAAREAAATGTAPSGHLRAVVDAVLPSLRRADAEGVDDIDGIVDIHIAQTVETLLGQSSVLADEVARGRCAVVGVSYRLAAGAVRQVAAVPAGFATLDTPAGSPESTDPAAPATV